jgi:hypothetical protein
VRRVILVLSAAVAVLATVSSSALAYTTLPNTAGIAGTDLIGGNTYPISSVAVRPAGNPFFAASGGGVGMAYYVTAYCGVVNNQNEYVMAGFPTAANTWAIDDTAGTLTVTGITVPAQFYGETFFQDTGQATITSGAGVLPTPMVWGADNATEKKAVVSYHKKINAATTDAARAQNLNLLVGVLG